MASDDEDKDDDVYNEDDDVTHGIDWRLLIPDSDDVTEHNAEEPEAAVQTAAIAVKKPSTPAPHTHTHKHTQQIDTFI